MKPDTAWEGRNGIDLLLSGSRGFLGVAWHSVRLPVFALLVVFEPIVRVVLATLAILGAFFAFFFEYLTMIPPFSILGHAGIFCRLRAVVVRLLFSDSNVLPLEQALLVSRLG